MSNPWMKFFPSDWRADPALRLCSLAARGLWIEMLGVMHEASPRGHLLVKGVSPSMRQLAALVGGAEDEVEGLVLELEAAGVFSRKKNGVIFSRRMESDENRTRIGRENGKKGGNPALKPSHCNPDDNPPLVNPPDKGRDNTQKPEARIQKERREEFLTTTTCPDTPRATVVVLAERRVDPHDEVLLAAGIDPAKDAAGKWHSSEAIHTIRQWRDLGLSQAEVLSEIASVMRGRTGPPGSLRYFTDAMRRAAWRKTDTPLTPIAADRTHGGRNAHRLDDHLDALKARLAVQRLE